MKRFLLVRWIYSMWRAFHKSERFRGNSQAFASWEDLKDERSYQRQDEQLERELRGLDEIEW